MTPPGSHAPKKPLPRFLGTRQGLWDVAVEPPFIPPGPALGPGQKHPPQDLSGPAAFSRRLILTV